MFLSKKRAARREGTGGHPMEERKLEALLAQDEDTLRTSLRAGASVDKDRDKFWR